MIRIRIAHVVGAALLAGGLPAQAKDAVNFKDHVRPILAQSCFNCHNADRARGGLDLTSYRALMAGGSGGEIVVSQDPDGSKLLGVMAHTMSPKMPPEGGKVGDDKLSVIRQWIEQGVRETASSAAAKPSKPRVDLSVGSAAIGRPDGPPIMPHDMPLGPIHHTPRAGAISSVAGHPWSPIVAVAGQKQVLVYHTETSELLGVIRFEHGQPQTLRFSWTGRLLMVGGGIGGQSGTVALYDVRTGEQVARVGEEVDAVLAADLDPTQRYVALGGPNKFVKGFDVATGEMIYKIDKHTEWVTAVAFSPDGNYLATGDRNGGLHVWEPDTGLPVFTLDGHRGSITALSWRFDGKVLASSGEDGQVKLWEVQDGSQVKAWSAHAGGARSVAFAEDARLVSTGRDQLVKVWKPDGNLQHQVKPFESLGMSVAFDTAGKAVVAGDLRGKLVRWSLQGDAKQVADWNSNPPTVKVALAQTDEQISATAAKLKQAQALAGQQHAAAERARQSLVQAQQALAAVKQAVPDNEQLIRKLEQQRKGAMQRRDKAYAEVRKTRDQYRQASNTLRAAEGESNRVGRDRDRAAQNLEKVSKDLVRLNADLEQAKQKSAEKPDDKGAARRVEDLARQIEAKQKEAQAKADELDRQTAAVTAADEKVAAAKQAEEDKRAVADRANQMAEAVNQEITDKGQAIGAARKALDSRRRGARGDQPQPRTAQGATDDRLGLGCRHRSAPR